MCLNAVGFVKGTQYITCFLHGYHARGILELLEKHPEDATGDWYWELKDLCKIIVERHQVTASGGQWTGTSDDPTCPKCGESLKGGPGEACMPSEEEHQQMVKRAREREEEEDDGRTV